MPLVLLDWVEMLVPELPCSFPFSHTVFGVAMSFTVVQLDGLVT